MRKCIFVAVLTVMAAAACSKENIASQMYGDEEVSGIEVRADVPEATKTTIDGVSVLWSKGDRIGFIADAGSIVPGGSSYAVKEEFAGKQTATVTVPVVEGADVTDGTTLAFTAYYPYSAKTATDGSPLAEILAEQDGQTGNWGYMSTTFSGTKADLVKAGLTFRHACAYIDFQFKSTELAGCPVTKVTLTSLDETKLFTGEYVLSAETGALAETASDTRYNQVSVSDPVASLGSEFQGKCAVVAPVDLSGAKVKIDVTYAKDGKALTQTKVIPGSKLAAGQKVTLQLNLDKTGFNVIWFEDATLGQALAEKFGSDGYLTMAQAAAVTKDEMQSFISDNWPSKGASFNEFQYFTNVSPIPSWQAKTIRKITLPNSVTVIPEYSFMKSGLGEINNTSQITVVGERAFYYCTTLRSIDLSAVTKIGKEAFRMILPGNSTGSTQLESVGDTKNLTYIGQSAFKACSSLKKIDLSNLKTVCAGAFSGCSALAEINSSLSALSEIPDNLFSDCLELQTSITLPAVIGAGAFSNCRKMEIASSDFEKVTSVGNFAFLQCWKVTGDISLKRIETLGNQAFKNTKITSVDMTGAPLAKIDDYCFYGCTGLKTVTISENTTTIGPGVFSGCESITEFHLLSKEPATVYGSTFTGTDSYIIYVPKGYVEIYKNAEGWSTYADRIQEEN